MNFVTDSEPSRKKRPNQPMSNPTPKESCHRRSSAGGEPVELSGKEKRRPRDKPGKHKRAQTRQRRVQHGQQHLAIAEVLREAVVVRRVMMRMDAGMSLGGNREETNRHQRARHPHRDHQAQKRELRLSVLLQSDCK